MPELPDVESAKMYVQKKAKGRQIEHSQMSGAKRLLKTTSAQKVARELKGHRIKDASRHGKYLFLDWTQTIPWRFTWA